MNAASEEISWEVIHDRYQRARSPYTCDTCSGEILKGENYRRVVGKLDGELRVFRQHGGMCLTS